MKKFSLMKMTVKTTFLALTIFSGITILISRRELFWSADNFITKGKGELPVDSYFHPLLTAFKLPKNNGSKLTDKKFRSGAQPTFLLVANDNVSGIFWQQQLLHISRDQCPLPCSYTGDHSKASMVDAIVFYVRHFKDVKSMTKNLPERDPSQPWIMLSFEAALKANDYNANYSVFNGVFNKTMTHRTDADVFTPHGFIVKNEDTQFLPNDWVLPTNDETILKLKKVNESRLAVAFISNCKAESGRLNYVKKMQKYIHVDVYGRCGNLKCGSSRYVDHAYSVIDDECFRNAGKNYLFYLAFENSICRDYGSEKLYNLLYYPIVPVVLGGAKYHDILPPNSYINAADFSPKDLAKYLLFLKNNSEKYDEYLHWRKYYQPSTVGGIRSMCQLCVKLYESSFYDSNIYKDFYKWFYLDADCFRRWINSTAGVVRLARENFY